MAESIDRLKRKRSTIRALTTKLLQKIERELGETEANVDEIEEALKQLSVKETALKDLDKDIEQGTNDLEELDAEIQGAQEYQDKIIVWKCRANRRIQKGNEDANTSVGTISVRAAAPSTVKLPRLTLEKFHGDASSWQTFWSQYDSAINQNTTLSKVDKFNYLKSYLGGTAANAISGLSLTDENYDSAIAILTERFGRKDLVVNAHMNKLLNLTPVKRSTDTDALRKLYDICEIQVRSLESLGVVSDTYGSLLCPILLKMIPDDIALEFNRKRIYDKEWNVRELLKFLQGEIECRERTSVVTKSDVDAPSKFGFKQKQAMRDSKWQNRDGHAKHRTPSAAALNTAIECKCIYCDKTDHPSDDCQNLSLEQRREMIRKQGRCFVCLKAKHIARFCKSKVEPCAICGKRHNKSVCNKEPITASNSEAEKGIVVSSASQCNTKTDLNKSVLMQTAGALAIGKSNNQIVRCLLDGGSQRTFIRQDVSRALDLQVVGEETLNIHTFGAEAPVSTTLRRVRVTLKNVYSCKCLELEALETPQVCSAIIRVPGNEILKEMERKNFQIADSLSDNSDSPITVLIGGDYYWQVVSGRVERLAGSLVALDTIFGWCVQGPAILSGMTLANASASIMKIAIDEQEAVSQQLRTFWELESLGITDKSAELTNSEEEAMRQFESKIVYKDGRYQVGLPWREDRVELPDNLRIAEKRLKNLTKRFKTDVAFYDEYVGVINDQINEGIVEFVGNDHLNRSEEECYFMPHHAVIKEEKTTSKLRVVYDASSHEKGCPSLNECLLSGPNLNPELLTVLLKFRRHKIAFMADIEKAFLQISLAEEDRDFVRFLWIDGSLAKDEEQKIVVMRMTRVLFGVTSSPFLLSATIRHHLKKYENVFPEICEMLRESLYVDDLISGAESTEEAYRASEQSKEIFGTAGMKLRKWKTNSNELQNRFQKENNEESAEFKLISDNETKTPLKVLGLSWDCKTDEFKFQIDSLLKFLTNRLNTKRYVLQASARIFDPIGFLSPFVIRVKCLFQALWERGLEWDDDLPLELKTTWDQWCFELPELRNVSIPRHYFSEADENIASLQLHGFCDASEKAYGAVIYIRYVTESGLTRISFVTAKTRVAPLKKITLPRLELMGALISARLINKLKDIFNLTQTKMYLWTDSTIVLHWIRGPARQWKPFVSNRVVEIDTLTDPQVWRHCSGQDNPADVLSRGCSISDLANDYVWWKGPTWLRLPENEWPNSFPNTVTEEQVFSELRSGLSPVVQLNCEVEKRTGKLLDLNKYSSLRKALRITAWIQRFIHNSKCKSEQQRGPLTAEELLNAEIYWIKLTQQGSFHTEFESLKAGKTVSRESRIADLNPFLDKNGLICVGGRLQKSEFSFAEKHPWILSSKDRFAELTVNSCHEQVFHSGLRDTLIQVRERYWILKGRQLVKSLLQRCLICRKFNAKSGMQIMAPLPRDRITEAPPFEITGIDFAGPLYTRGNEKAYIALFTCAVTRAVHLELVSDLSTEKFLLAFRRFLSRRGLCRIIYSDNAKTFKRANQDLKDLWKSLNSQELKDFYGKNGISWKFIVERAAWWGGFWERLVRSVKTCLRKTLGKTSLTFEELQTKLTEVEAVLNSRPITFTYNDAGEPSPLTPAHFLIGERLIALPPHTPKTVDASSTREQLTKKWKYQNELLNRIWARWRKDYLLELKSASCCKQPTRTTDIKLGDIVIIDGDRTPRLMWKTGKVVDVFRGRDDKVRSCAVRLSTGTILKRPVQLLYPLEIGD